MVPDVSGLDKVFDYLVPDSLRERVWIGARVRVNLNNRRVGGWIVALETSENDSQSQIAVDRLLPIVSVSGHGVEPILVPLTRWMAEQYFGSWRATLSSASAPHVRSQPTHAQHGTIPSEGHDEVSRATREVVTRGSGLIVVPPLGSALSVVTELASRGPVLVVCPTQRMATLGAASLRRKGLVTALIPEQWDLARAGVDVVIGARSAVLAPCSEMSSIVVIDEHDELLHEERSPAWNAVDVACERARRANVPCVLTSPIPSAQSVVRYQKNTALAQTAHQWPSVDVVNLDDVPVAGSLLSSELLAAASHAQLTVACVLNTKGKARLIVCRSCRHVQACPQCSSLLTQNNETLLCVRCERDFGSVCLACGRTSFIVPRGGIGQLASQLRASVSRDVIEVSGDSHDSWTTGSIFVGTEAALYRLSRVDVVVFADIDRDLGAPRMTAPREVLSLIARAARLVGEDGKIILQTRRPDHPVISAFRQPLPMEALMEWCAHDVEQRKMFSLPPYSTLVEVSLREPYGIGDIPELEGLQIARHEDVAVVRGAQRSDLIAGLAFLREKFGTALRAHADPLRY